MNIYLDEILRCGYFKVTIGFEVIFRLHIAPYDILKQQINGRIKKNMRLIGKALCDFLLIYFSMIFLFHEKDNISIDKILGLDLFMMFDKAIR